MHFTIRRANRVGAVCANVYFSLVTYAFDKVTPALSLRVFRVIPAGFVTAMVALQG